MKEVDNIKDLFKEKLGNFEAPVRPELWSNISSQITVNAATTGGGLSVFAKTAIGFTIAASVAVVGYFVVKDDSIDKKDNSNPTATISGKKVSSSEILNEDITSSNVESSNLNQAIKNDNKESLNLEIFSQLKDITLVFDPLLEDKFIEKNDGQKTEEVIPVDYKKTVESSQSSETTPASENNSANDAFQIIDTEKNTEGTVETDDYFIAELPNVFSPNGDGVNELLSIESRGLIDFNIVILDQNSKIVYQSNQPDFVWDGIGSNGLIVPEGNYLYYITARDSKGKFVNKHSYLRVEINR